MIDEKTLSARQFISEIQELAVKYNLPYFVVTDGASAYSSNGCDAVDRARAAHVDWETANGIDPHHDWSGDINS